MEKKRMKVMDKELILICALMAVVGALGIVALILVFFGRTIDACNPTILAASYCGLCGILWGVLLIFNLEK